MFPGMLIGNETWPSLMAGLCRRRAVSLVCLAVEPMIEEVGSLPQGKKVSDLLVTFTGCGPATPSRNATYGRK